MGNDAFVSSIHETTICIVVSVYKISSNASFIAKNIPRSYIDMNSSISFINWISQLTAEFVFVGLLFKVLSNSVKVFTSVFCLESLRRFPLQWRHNGRDCVWNHQPHDCLLGQRAKKTSEPHVTGLYAGNSPVTGEFPAQMASSAENVAIWWRHHAKLPISLRVSLM